MPEYTFLNTDEIPKNNMAVLKLGHTEAIPDEVSNPIFDKYGTQVSNPKKGIYYFFPMLLK